MNQFFNCPFMNQMIPYEQMYRDEDEFVDEFEDDPDAVEEVVRPMYMHKPPRCSWPYRPCFYGGRWHCCRRRRPRPRPYGMY